MVALAVHAEDAHAVGLRRVVPVADLEVAPEDGLQPGGKGMRIEAQAPEDVHQVGERQRPAASLHHLVNRRVDADDPVRDGVFRMKSKMNEFGFGHGRRTPLVGGIFSWR